MLKLAFWGLFVLGFAGCATFGIGPVLQRAGGNWASPFVLAGCVAGVALIALAVAFAMGARPAFLATDGAMFVALGVLIAVKVAIASVQVVASTPLR